MLDTIIIQIHRNGYHITDHNKFLPSTRNMEASTEGYAKYINNPTKEDKKKGVYKPKLTIHKRGRDFPLKIEFSAPKLLYGNNLDEVETADFDRIIKVLQTRLSDMGVQVWSKHLESAEVIGLHPSKNIQLTGGFTAGLVIRELSKIDFSLKYDLEKITYRNGGEALQLYSSTNSVTFYDKINDLTKPLKRAIDKEQTLKQKTIFDFIKAKKMPPEVLRYEVRLSHKRRLNKILKTLGFSPNPTLKQIFDKKNCQAILLYYWNYFFAKQIYLFSVNNSPQKLFQIILKKFKGLKIIKAATTTGILLLCKDTDGIRGLRKIVDAYRPKTNWAVLKRQTSELEDILITLPTHTFVKDIEQALDRLEPFKIK